MYRIASSVQLGAVDKALAWHRETAVDGLNVDLQACIDAGPMSNVTYDEFDHEAAKAAMAPLYEEYANKYQEYFDRIAKVEG